MSGCDDSEGERGRLDELAALEEDGIELDRFTPGSYGAHEALHMASVLREMVETQLMMHPAVLLDARYHAHARAAFAALDALYRTIGSDHLKA